ncbi:protein ORF57 [Cyprinid herpesvirus 2]|uniref:ORF57 n=1 Tax=Cyprinid herpesvirus 2 TaxID=317878 RepID=A0A0E3T4P9_CYHV2|nr:hypothetical protein [Cyprinid herpesvirus 2]AMB21628.1 ORF57 [Cyprinid herpesvirus 2]QAU54782.1 protein ORF57 [Cyprinid herpesvirus 2]
MSGRKKKQLTQDEIIMAEFFTEDEDEEYVPPPTIVEKKRTTKKKQPAAAAAAAEKKTDVVQKRTRRTKKQMETDRALVKMYKDRDWPPFVEECLRAVNIQRYDIRHGEFPPYKIAMALSKKSFDNWDEVDYAALRDCLCEGLHLQAVQTHKLYVLASGMFLWGKSSWMDPQLLSRLYSHDVPKIKLLERVTYGFMMALQECLKYNADGGGGKIPGLDDDEMVTEMKNFVLFKGFHHHYVFCDHHWQHWALGRDFHGVLPEVVVQEMIADGLACMLERAGPYETPADWIDSFSVAAYPDAMKDQLKEHLAKATINCQGLNFAAFKNSLAFLADMHKSVSIPRWRYFPTAKSVTLDTFDDCACDVHVQRHVQGQTGCSCMCCERSGCTDEKCKSLDQLERVELRSADMEDEDDLESVVSAAGARSLNTNWLHEPKIIAVRAPLVGVGDRGPGGTRQKQLRGRSSKQPECGKGCACGECPKCPRPSTSSSASSTDEDYCECEECDLTAADFSLAAMINRDMGSVCDCDKAKKPVKPKRLTAGATGTSRATGAAGTSRATGATGTSRSYGEMGAKPKAPKKK